MRTSLLSLVSLVLVTVASADSEDRYYLGAINPIAPENVSNDTAVSKRSAELVSHGPSVQRNVLKRAVNGISDALPSPWAYMGCFTEVTSSRALSGDSYHGDDMSQEKCIAYCDGKGYGVAGVEWGRECYCGYLLDSASDKAPETDCKKPCAGNSGEVCGEGGRLNVFTNGDAAPAILAASGEFDSLGCYSDHSSARTLTTRMSLPGNVRVSDCTTACAAQGFPYAGLEFGKECFCGASIQNGGAPIPAKSCNMVCTADKSQYCGGAAAINIYKSSKPVTGGPSTLPDGWIAQSCYTDSPSRRALSYRVPSFNKFSAAQCVSQCDSLGYEYAGTEYGSECYCGNSIDGGNSQASSGCDMSCAGNQFDTCGGAGRISIYKADCKGTGDCHFNYGKIDVTHPATKKECSDRCHANPDCVVFQVGYDRNVLFCNTFSKPIPVIRAHSTSTYCLAAIMYNSVCSL
ncbi:WSC domain-containing protein [Colletotrichum graminicola M1.001]|uniref:WSC domain-containing protein n=1 Tax=Colletotrichum graminicola (strain M1.001 / M2 / FGSC 10212) TaxID=645133 RepID=E3QVA0_COLGM|nr:WSC domain-containing protein [Colletotrichum graminicola M1.001]EFQ34788.1 WSC domain-containing protein [Colletotrichum graminicola M1.001]